jgi:periodic tryptophan protein 1
MSMITTSAWVRRGVAAQFPTKYEINEEEMDRISKLARMQLEEAQGDLKAAQEDEEMEEDKKEGADDAMEDDSKEEEEEKKKEGAAE